MAWIKHLTLAALLTMDPSSAKEGVILLHGLCRTHASMSKMETALSTAGFIVHNVGYPSRTATIATLSEGAIGYAWASEKLTGCSKIHFVTHSLGGILVRDYMARHPQVPIGRVVMLGPPNQGSEVVDRLGSWWLFKKLNGPAGSELGTRNHSTPHTLGPVMFELGVIAGDRSINWINSWMIPGKDDGKVSVASTKVAGMKDHLVIHATHPFLMKNNQAIASTITFLQTGAFQPPP